ncbi:MAG: hypothetical protein GW893_24565, partial [Armatimonadetes bacterium]|nr:hypothetical protein [Armatimonadota bacterium]
MRAGWHIKPLGSLCDILDNQRKPITKRDRIAGDYPYYGATGILDFVAGFLFDEPLVLVGEDGAKWASGENTAFSIEGKCWVNNHAHVLRPHRAEIADSWLIHFLVHFDLSEFVSGLTVPKLNQGSLREIPIPVPPLPEQQRIVGILDEAFDGIATAKANAEQNLQNARALFESHLQSVFTQRGEGWVEKRLGDVVTRLTNGYVGPTRNIYHETGVPYLLARHVKNNRLLFDGRTFITEEFNQKNKKSMLKADDVLLVQSGHIGHSAVVTKEHEGHNCHAMIVITPVQGAFIGAFLSLFFNSSEMKQKFQEIRSGSTVPHLTCGEVKELMVAFPDLATQQRIVDQAREFEDET